METYFFLQWQHPLLVYCSFAYNDSTYSESDLSCKQEAHLKYSNTAVKLVQLANETVIIQYCTE